MSEEKQRFIQEFVPGKQLTLSHVIANPNNEMLEMLGIDQAGALGIMTSTPSETVIIAGDIATKSANVRLGFLDRFTGSIVVVGDVAEVEVALLEITRFLSQTLGYTPAAITKS